MNDKYSTDLPLSIFNKVLGGILPVLDACGISSLSEFLGAFGALNRTKVTFPWHAIHMSGAFDLLDEDPPFDSREEWESYKKFWLEDDASFEPVKVFSDFTPRVPSESVPVSTPLRTKFCLPESPFPVRNQGAENTCVAHAVASAIEYYTGRQIDAETTRKLFEASAEHDGIEADGALLSATLFYAREWKLWRGERSILANDVTLWKATLVGAEGEKPSPIVASFATYPGWLYSKAARLSGKWTLPLPEERENFCVGKHAALVVGYCDDGRFPGGGYFIVRNSWGEEYACESPIGKPGYSLVPYEYVQKYCAEAYAAASERVETFKQKFVRVLGRDAREWLPNQQAVGRTINQGAVVVAHPNEPDKFRVYSEETKNDFIESGYAWTRNQRVRNYFPTFGAEARGRVDARFNASRRFINGVKTNLDALVGTESPFSPRGFLSGVRKFCAVEEIADLSKEVRTRLAYQNKLHSKLDLWRDAPDAWQSALETTARVKIWRVDDGRRAFAVVGIWLAPIRFSPIDAPSFEAPTAETIGIALEVVKKWKRDSKEEFETICETFGAFDGGWQGLEGVASGVPYVFSTFEPNERGGRWRTTICESVVDERTRALTPYLRPTTLAETTAYVQSVLEYESRVFFGDLTVEYVASKSGVPQGEVEAALDELVKNAKYELYRTARNENAYRKRG